MQEELNNRLIAQVTQNPNAGFFFSLGDNHPANIFAWVITFILGFAAVAAVLFIMYGGLQYIMSGANEDLAKQGKNRVRNAVIGLIIIILSYTIITVITRTLTDPSL